MASIKEFLVEYGIVNGARLTKKDKLAFIKVIKQFCQDNDVSYSIEKFVDGNHITINKTSSGNLTLLVPYDTPAVSYYNTSTYLPLNVKTKLRNKKKSIRNKAVFDVGLLLIISILAYITVLLDGVFKYLSILAMVIMIIFFLLAQKERTLKVNMNFNSSALALALKLLQDNRDISLILIDNYYKNIKWFDYLQSKKIFLKPALMLEALAGSGEIIFTGPKNLINNRDKKITYLKSEKPYSTISVGRIESKDVVVDLNRDKQDYKVDVVLLEEIKQLIKNIRGGVK